jgi:hypothetical protein
VKRALWLIAVATLSATAAADPKATPVNIKPFRDNLLVFQDATGGTYVVDITKDARKVFYGTSAKLLYAQDIIGAGADGDAWSLNTWAPRISQMRPGAVERRPDGSFRRYCDGKDDAGLTQVTGDKAKAILDKSQFFTEFMVHRAYMLARDDSGVYYYVDRLTKDYGGKGYRVFVGKKGAMKQLPLLDTASDTAGEVFSTKTGDLRLTKNHEANIVPDTVVWIKGEKRSALISLDVDMNSTVIFKDLGIYTFLGTLCDNL